ncbi:hypothetical protein HHI36_013617 [Cryptolaemus montrouzieri]|uniref:EB domain-containing protein n=1 Tax=Cryptolaemus montrouzieri TaxID=559131 RepID=A0ABD2NHQ9_9CUCU
MFKKLLCYLVLLFLGAHFINCDENQIVRYSRPKCRTDIDCHTNAFCFGNDNTVIGYCKCKNDYVMYTEGKYYECLRELVLGDTCRRDIQCQIEAGPLAICNFENTCVCNSTISHVFVDDGKCYDTRLLGEFCQVDENCWLADHLVGEDEYAICLYGVCTCPIGKRPTENKKRCIDSRNLGEKCDNDVQCQVNENAVCRTICICETGFTRSTDGQKCWKAALKFGDVCLEDRQCSRYLDGSICRNKVCACPISYHSYENSCRKDVKPDEPCFEDGDCIIFKELENIVDCNKGTCTCLYGKSYDDRLCLPESSHSSRAESGLLVLSFIYFVYQYLIY